MPPSTPRYQRLLKPADVAVRLAVSRAQAYRIMRRMPHQKIGRSLRVDETDFVAWLDAQTLPPQPSSVEPFRKFDRSLTARALDAVLASRPSKSGSKSSLAHRLTFPRTKPQTSERDRSDSLPRPIVRRTKPRDG